LVGVGGQQKDELEKMVRHWDLEDYVELVPRVSHKEALGIMAGADLLLILQGGTSLCVPAKLFEYMALNKPILGLTPEGATADILQRYPLGKVVDPYDPDKILLGIIHFLMNGKMYFQRNRIANSSTNTMHFISRSNCLNSSIMQWYRQSAEVSVLGSKV